MNPYKIKVKNRNDSREINDPKDKLKLKLVSNIRKIILDIDTESISEKTGLDKSDVSRLKIGSFQRFTIDRLIKILSLLGYETKITITKKA
jgi:predicted XRE-type DNA-binding protein